MPLPSSKIVSSLEAILGSIENDDQVFRWFHFLILQSPIKAKLSKDSNSPVLYKKLSAVSLLEILLSLGFIGFIFWIYTHPHIFLWSAVLVFLPAYIKLMSSKKKIVVDLSRHILKEDFTEDQLRQKTLYQVAEHYGREYKIPSLVDTIFKLDNVARLTLIFGFIFTAFIYPLKFWEILVVTALIYMIVMTTLRLNLLYRFLK